MPQEPGRGSKQLGPEQQPWQRAASHLQVPLTQRWPTPQAPPEPQRQVPATQLSALVASQGLFAPHLQTPSVQLSERWQAWQTWPPAPHWVRLVGAQTPAEVQQLPGQLFAVHLQLPPEHSWPA